MGLRIGRRHFEGMGIDVMDLTGNRLRYNSAHLRVTGLRCSRV